MKKLPRKNSKHDLVPLDMVFKPDPNGDLEDDRPVEIRKGRRNQPNHTIPWEVIKE